MQLGLKELTPLMNMAKEYLSSIDSDKYTETEWNAMFDYYNFILKVLTTNEEPIL